jgi:hypothetical protein
VHLAASRELAFSSQGVCIWVYHDYIYSETLVLAFEREILLS